VRFRPEDQGALHVDMKVPQGRNILRFVISDNEFTARSNPVQVKSNKSASDIYWGDIHGHTLLSDGHGTLDEFYRYCRDVAALDICAATDHGFMISDAATWKRSKKITEKFNQPGRFVTLQAYEWSGMTNVGGDHNVYFRSSDPPIFRSRSYYDYRNQQTYHGSEPQVNFIEDLNSTLLQRFKEGNVLTIPHYGGRKANPAWHNPRIERLIEIFSDHQRSHKWAYEFLKRGYRLGIIASNDSHTGRPGYGFLHNPLQKKDGVIEIGTSLMAVFSKDLSRDTIFTSLYNRRTYATTGDRILLDLRLGNARMGEEITGKEPATIYVTVEGTAPVKTIEILRDTKVVKSVQFTSEHASLEWKDQTPLALGATAVYWVRVVQANKEEAVSSPIWLTRK
jgi:hypothetical protein